MATGMLEEYFQFLLANVEHEELRRLWAIAAQVDKLAAANNPASLNAVIQHRAKRPKPGTDRQKHHPPLVYRSMAEKPERRILE